MLLEMKGINKAFEKVVALDQVNFYLRRNEIHGLLGGNGAGKTTLMNILFGLYRMDSGEIILNSKPIAIHSPKDAIQHGIGMVHQHFLQISNFTVLENIVLGTKIKHSLTMNLSEEAQKVKELCQRFGLEVPLNSKVEDLPMGSRQKVEILKAIYRGVKILILDEPTTNLTPQEVDALFVSLRVMVNEGMSIIFITHKLREVMSVCDQITVLREGKNVVSLKRGEASEEVFVRGMVGDKMDIEKSVIFSTNRQALKVSVDQPVMLELKEVNVVTSDNIPRLKNVSFSIQSGEILGVAGVAGNGQRELAECVAGIRKPRTGSIQLNSKETQTRSTAELLEQGMAYIPEDRIHDGFLPKANVAQNLILGSHRQPPYSRKGWINWSVVFTQARKMIGEYNIKTSGPEEIGGNLSGGNIQRVLIARAFSHVSKLLVAHNPTRGLDIPSMDFVYTKLLACKNEGMATLLISEDLDELLLLCDRVAVVYRGEILDILPREKFEKYTIGRLMSGIKEESTLSEK